MVTGLGMEPASFWCDIDGVIADHFERKEVGVQK